MMARRRRRHGSRERIVPTAVVVIAFICFCRDVLAFSVSFLHSTRRRSQCQWPSSWCCSLAATTTRGVAVVNVATTGEEPACCELQNRRILVEEAVRREHQAEVDTGFSIFGRTQPNTNITIGGSFSKDADFVCHKLPRGCAGPDEFDIPRGGDKIYQTIRPLLSREECHALIQEARNHIQQDLLLSQQGNKMKQEDSSSQPSNSELGEARVSQLPRAKDWLCQALHERFFPLLESRFGIPSHQLTLHDALIIGYGYFGGGARSQPVHRDSSLLSLNVALSPRESYDPNGGGTFFEGLFATTKNNSSPILSLDQGHAMCHAGGAPHAGRGIAHGERWILVLFCIAETYPQLARRCHAGGITAAQRDRDLPLAQATLEAGLAVAPRDHLLHTSLGMGVHMARGREHEARRSLMLAALSYPHCVKARMSLGRMLMTTTMTGRRRPRAALRQYDSVLEWMEDRDLQPEAWMPLRAAGWEARVSGAHAALLCAQRALNNDDKKEEERPAPGSFDADRHLRHAVERLRVARNAAPDHTEIPGMLAMAEELLERATN